MMELFLVLSQIASRSNFRDRVKIASPVADRGLPSKFSVKLILKKYSSSFEQSGFSTLAGDLRSKGKRKVKREDWLSLQVNKDG